MRARTGRARAPAGGKGRQGTAANPATGDPAQGCTSVIHIHPAEVHPPHARDAERQSASIRTRDGWAVPHAVITVTDMTGTHLLRADAEADAEGAVRDATALTPGPRLDHGAALGP